MIPLLYDVGQVANLAVPSPDLRLYFARGHCNLNLLCSNHGLAALLLSIRIKRSFLAGTGESRFSKVLAAADTLERHQPPNNTAPSWGVTGPTEATCANLR
jgi:hypothetical protein